MSSSKWLKLPILLIGSVFVIWIGYSIIRSKEDLNQDTEVDIPIGKVITTACIVTWFNPQGIIDGSMMLGTFRVSMPENSGAQFICGVCLALVIWWGGLSTLVSLFSKKFTAKTLNIINIICGTIIIFYGIKLLINFIKLAGKIL